MDEPTGLADQVEVALLTVAAHEDGRRCLNCSAGVCGVWWWALKLLERHPGPTGSAPTSDQSRRRDPREASRGDDTSWRR
ncbi:hypothetical protein [Micromonospora sp. NPDC093277]|uniref:hypothetical protein n=1 Tax=Micromonospora sp. NPDC093277 TaxID=3364291 RepID=UPI003805FB35